MSEMEVTVQRVATVDSVAEAFAFVMEWLDVVGDEPRIEISPFVDLLGGIREVMESGGDGDLLGVTRFEVKVVGVEVVER